MAGSYDALQAEIAALRQRQLFFIGGAAKSGTTWLQLLLDRHPAISCKGEGHFPSFLLPALMNAILEYNELIARKNRTVFGELPGGYPQLGQEQIAYLLTTAIELQLSAPASDPAIRVIGEKTPDNVRFFPQLQAVFPSAKFIQIVRDGRDCAVSGWFHNLRTAPDWLRENFASMEAYITRTAGDWAENVGAGTRFGAARPQSYLAIRYEDLVAEPVPVLARVLNFLGVSADLEILDLCLDAGAFETLSGGRRPGEEDRNSFFRKGVSGDWRNYFTAETSRRFEAAAGEWLERYGYRSGSLPDRRARSPALPLAEMTRR
jgi:hypothetical protein